MRVDCETLYVMQLYFNMDKENNIKPISKLVCVVKLVSSNYLFYSSNLYKHIKIICVYIAAIIDKITTHFWYIMHWKSYALYYL